MTNKPYRPRTCREPACRAKLNREEVLYNGGFCDPCVEALLARGEAEKQRLYLNQNNTPRR